jgi:hypothetical protein
MCAACNADWLWSTAETLQPSDTLLSAKLPGGCRLAAQLETRDVFVGALHRKADRATEQADARARIELHSGGRRGLLNNAFSAAYPKPTSFNTARTSLCHSMLLIFSGLNTNDRRGVAACV